MSRIRSVHPGFFRDDRLVPCSAFARLLFIGLGVEADDKGIFEWKPVTIKMSVFPGDNVDVGELLAELVDADAIRQFEAGGKHYGAIRNFRKYQKPKTPNDVHPMADGVAEYVSLPPKGENDPVEQKAFPPKGEKSFQMEEGGGKKEEKAASQLGASKRLYDRLIEAASSRGQCHQNLAMGIGPITDLIAKGYDLDADILPVISERANPTVRSWSYFVAVIVQRHAERQAIPIKQQAAPVDWGKRVNAFYDDGIWAMGWGPKPGDPGCEAPADLLKRTAA